MSNVYGRAKNSIMIGLTVATFVGAAAGVQLSQTASVSAAACDKVNIIYCGLEGSSDAAYTASLKSMLAKGSDNGHADLKAVYAWAGASESDMSSMTDADTKIGTLYRNGDVKVDGKVVATDAWVTARFTEGNGFVKVTDGVWARKTTTSFANESVKALVHYDENKQVDFVAMIDCGNAVKVTPVKVTPPTPPTPVTPTPVPPTPVTPTPVVTPVVAPTPEAPVELPNAGPGAIAGLFAGTSALGAIGHQFITRRRNRA